MGGLEIDGVNIPVISSEQALEIAKTSGFCIFTPGPYPCKKNPELLCFSSYFVKVQNPNPVIGAHLQLAFYKSGNSVILDLYLYSPISDIKAWILAPEAKFWTRNYGFGNKTSNKLWIQELISQDFSTALSVFLDKIYPEIYETWISDS